MKCELGLSGNDYNALRNWFPGRLPPLFQVQKAQSQLKPELEPILDGVMVADPLKKLLIPELTSFVKGELDPGLGEQQVALPLIELPDTRAAHEVLVKFGADGFTVQNQQTKKLISMEQSGFLVMLPGILCNSRNSTRLVSKQTMPPCLIDVNGPAEDTKKGHSGEDIDHLKPVMQKFNEMVRDSALLEVEGRLLKLKWLLSSDYKLQGLVFGLGNGAALAAFFCMWCLTRCSERDTTIRHIPCERSFDEMRLRGAVWEILEKECKKDDGKLDGRLVAKVMSLLLGQKMTFEQSKEWAQSMQYEPLVEIPNHQAVMEVLHASINLVRKHYGTVKALAKQQGTVLDEVMKRSGLEKGVTGWDWEKSKEVRKRSGEWLTKGLASHPKLPALIRIWELLDKLLDICEDLKPTEDDISWFGLHFLYFGGLVRMELGKLHPFSAYDHFLICHAWLQLKHFGSLMKLASFYLEAVNALWKAALCDSTSKGGGKGEGTNADRQEFMRAAESYCCWQFQG